MKKNFLIALLILPLLSGCITIKGTGTGGGNDGGVFKSSDYGETWMQKVNVPEVAGRISGIPNVNVKTLQMDPNDHYAIYLGTESDGLFYTYDGGERWNHVVPQFASGLVSSIAVDYFNKCTIYVTMGNKIYKSDDCSRSWRPIYFDTDEAVRVTVVKTENYNKNVVYAGTTRGEVLKSTDFGTNWRVINQLGQEVSQIVIDKDDTRIVYVATIDGFYKTLDGGANWINLNTDIYKYDNARQFRFIAQDMIKPNTFIWASPYGLIKSDNGGENWEEIKLITPPNGANILAVAIDPKDSKTIYYCTDTTFYKTADSGTTWKSKKLPTSRWCDFLLIDPSDTKTIYMGTRYVEQ